MENDECNKKKEKKKVKVIYKFNSKYNLLYSSLTAIFIGILVLLCAISAESFKEGIKIIGILIGYILVVFIGTKFYKKAYSNYTYIFLEDRILYKDNLLQKNDKVILYERIKTVDYKQKLLQRLFNLGTIIIIIDSQNVFGEKIEFISIENPEIKCRKINEILEQRKNKEEN